MALRLPDPSLGWRVLMCVTLFFAIVWGVDSATRRQVPEPPDPHAFQIQAYRQELGPRHSASPLESLGPEDFVTSDDIED